MRGVPICIVLMVVFASMGCIQGDDGMSGEEKKGRVVMVIAPQDFRDEELLVPKRALEAAGFDTVVASTRKGESVVMLGARVSVDATIDELDPSQYDGIVVVGGSGTREYLWGNAQLHELIRAFFAQNKTVGAICLAPVVLAEAGVLDGKRATVFPDSEAISELEEGGASYVRSPVVLSVGVITAEGPKAAESFAAELIHDLEERA